MLPRPDRALRLPGRSGAPHDRRSRNDWATVQQWSAEHVAAMVVTGVVATLLVTGARRREDPWAVAVGRRLAVVIAGAFVCEQLTYALRGEWTAQVNLPLQLSDAVTLAAVAALWHPGWMLLVELVYFWALSASVQAVLTPDLRQTFPDVLYFTYFATHSGAIAAACLLVFGARRAPRPGAVWRAYAITAAFAAVAAGATVLSGGNYMFLRHKPAGASALDLMGPWPVYILVGAVVGLVMFGALAALARRSARRAPPPADARAVA
jgi:hypothetical integral membrane protein (TIGR02206 family)